MRQQETSTPAAGPPPGTTADLHAGVERLRDTLRAADVATFEWDVLTQRLEGSPNLEEMMGLPRGAFAPTFEGWLSAVLEEDRKGLQGQVEEGLRRGGGFEWDLRVRRGDELRWLSARGVVHLDGQRRPASVQGVLFDITDRKRAEAGVRERESMLEEALRAVQDTEQHFRALAETMPQLAWTARPDGVRTYYNRRWCDYTGFTEAELFAGKLLDAVHPDEAQLTQRLWNHALESGAPFTSEYRLRDREGAYRWFLSRAIPVRDASGQITGWFGTSTDIDAQKRAGEAQHFLAEASRELASSLDWQATLRRVAKLAVPQFADWSAVDVLDEGGKLRRLAVEHVDPEKVALAHQLHQRYPADLDSPHGIGEVLRSGKTMWLAEIPDSLLVAAAKDPEQLQLSRELGLRSYIAVPLKVRDQILGVFTLVQAESGRRYTPQDVAFLEEVASHAALAMENAKLFHQAELRTEALAAAERARRLSEERYRSLIEATSELVWTRSPKGELVGDLSGWARFTGQSEAEQAGWGWLETIHPDDRARTRLSWAKAVDEQPAVYEVEYRMRRRDGEYRYMQLTAVPVREPTGAVREWVGVNTDITESHAAEEQIRLLNVTLEERVKDRTHQLQEVNKELESFTYSVSHDLRAPLRHITGFAQLLEQHAHAQLDEKGRKYLHTIAGASQQGGKLVDDLLTFSRMGKADMRRTQVALRPLVDEVRRDLTLDAKGRTVRWEVGPLPEVRADPALLRMVLKNLLDNALKYTGPRAEAVIEIGAIERPEEVEIFVRDNGVGFEMEYVDKLFGVFQRLHSAEQFEGTGIGLANVRRIISRHGGRTWAEGAVDKGARIAFTLPKRDRPSGEQP